MAEDHSIYRLFDRLPTIIKEKCVDIRRTGQESPQPATPPAAPPRDDKNLLAEAMRDVRPLGPAKRRVSTPVAPECPPSQERKQQRELLCALREDTVINVTNLPEYMEGFVEGVNPLTLEKLRACDFSIQRTLDLHGLGVDHAHAAFHNFIGDAVRSHVRCVKVIHGRGLRSKFEPMLKEKLKEWIVRAMHRRWVIAFASAVMADGGPGATVILLRTHPDKKRLHIIG